jgi:phage baseplate assembly protein W
VDLRRRLHHEFACDEAAVSQSMADHLMTAPGETRLTRRVSGLIPRARARVWPLC